MNSSPDALTPAEQQAFSQSVENVKQASIVHLGAHTGDTYPIAFYGNLHRGIDRVVQAAVDRDVGVACHTGCSFCCSARVAISAPEVFLIADAIRLRPESEIEVVVKRLRQHADMNANKTDWKQRTPCPFLDNDLCTIYSLRPVGCRKAHSLDLAACQAGADVLPQSLDIVLAAEALTLGTSEAYRASGLDMAHYEFVAALWCALVDSESKDRWLSGERVFDSDSGAEQLGT